jgi:hypothetical protein
MPDPREHLGVAELGGAIYAFGGRRPDGGVAARLDRYVPEADRWTQRADAPLATSGVALLRLGDRLYTAGGEEPHNVKVFGGAAAYSPGSDTWTAMPDLPEPLHGYAAAEAAGRLYVFAGSGCPGFNPTRQVRSSPVPSG